MGALGSILKELSTRPFDRKRYPEAPEDVHGDRRALAKALKGILDLVEKDLADKPVTKLKALEIAKEPLAKKERQPRAPKPEKEAKTRVVKPKHPCSAPGCDQASTHWKLICSGHLKALPADLQAALGNRVNGKAGRPPLGWPQSWAKALTLLKKGSR